MKKFFAGATLFFAILVSGFVISNLYAPKAEATSCGNIVCTHTDLLAGYYWLSSDQKTIYAEYTSSPGEYAKFTLSSGSAKVRVYTNYSTTDFCTAKGPATIKSGANQWASDPKAANVDTHIEDDSQTYCSSKGGGIKLNTTPPPDYNGGGGGSSGGGTGCPGGPDCTGSSGGILDSSAACSGNSSTGTCLKSLRFFGTDVQNIVNFLAGLVGIIVVGMIILGGIQYATAGDNPQAITAAKGRITNALIALFAFIFLYSLMQWLIPGGIF